MCVQQPQRSHRTLEVKSTISLHPGQTDDGGSLGSVNEGILNIFSTTPRHKQNSAVRRQAKAYRWR